jgi:c-di-AMP phosphodiesterase-like protein
MRALILSFLVFLLLSSGIVKSQATVIDTPLKLEELFDRLVDNYNDTERIRINDSIRLILDSYVKSDTVFSHKFSNLRYLGQIMSPDSLLKIITSG